MMANIETQFTYTIRLSQKSNGVDTAEMDWDGRPFRAESRHGASMALARRVVEAGAPDGPWEALAPQTGTRALYGPSLHRMARLTVEENDRSGPRFTRWVPRPEF